jgi:hypothetical protein
MGFHRDSNSQSRSPLASVCVTTLALGFDQKKGLQKVQAKSKAHESYLPRLKVIHLLGGQCLCCTNPHYKKSVREWTFTLLSEFPFWELESRWILKSLEINYKGQNPLDWRVLYIIGIILEQKCIKWVLMTHLNTSNTHYGQKKGRESNW